MSTQYEIGQVWCIQWDNGDPLSPERYERQSMLLGIDYDTRTGDAIRLHFGAGMTPNSKAGSISPNEFQRHKPILISSPREEPVG